MMTKCKKSMKPLRTIHPREQGLKPIILGKDATKMTFERFIQENKD